MGAVSAGVLDQDYDLLFLSLFPLYYLLKWPLLY